MGCRKPERGTLSHEVGLVIEAVSPSQEKADALCSFARSTLLHYGYPGRKATAATWLFCLVLGRRVWRGLRVHVYTPYSRSTTQSGIFQLSLWRLDVSDSVGTGVDKRKSPAHPNKNAGPFELTLDIIFKSEQDYQMLKGLDFFTPELMASLYGVSRIRSPKSSTSTRLCVKTT